MQAAQTSTSCWEAGKRGPTPRCPTKPNISIIESLSKSHLGILPERHLRATLFAEEAFNKIYTIYVSGPGVVECKLPFIFRVTLPVEPFYKTASEVATLSYIQEHTSVPVPRVVAHSSTANNELGFEWILIEIIPGVALEFLWHGMDMEAKVKETRMIARYFKQLHDRGSFGVIGSLYFREDLLDRKVRTVPTTDNKFVIGPTVTASMFVGGMKLRLPRNLGPYSDDGEYMTALLDAEVEDMRFLQSLEAYTYVEFDQDLAQEAPEIADGLRNLQEARQTLFPSPPRHPPRQFTLSHRDLSLSNIFVDPATHDITGIVDWECAGTRPLWEKRYPAFLKGREIEEKPEPLSPGVKDWEDWEKVVLRRSWDEELGHVDHEDDITDKKRLDWKGQLDVLEAYVEQVVGEKSKGTKL